LSDDGENLAALERHNKASVFHREYLEKYLHKCFDSEAAKDAFKFYSKCVDQLIKGEELVIHYEFPGGANVPYATICLYNLSIWAWNEYWANVYASKEMSLYEIATETDFEPDTEPNDDDTIN
jgi:hypothetical protein